MEYFPLAEPSKTSMIVRQRVPTSGCAFTFEGVRTADEREPFDGLPLHGRPCAVLHGPVPWLYLSSFASFGLPACLPLNPLRVISPGRGPLLNTTRVFPESNCILLFAPRYEVPGEENLDVREMHLTNFSINWESGAFAPRLPRKSPAKRTGRCPGAAQAAHRHLATGARAFSEFLGRVLKLWEDSTERARERHNECVISLTESEVPGANVTSGALAYRVAFLHHMRLGHGDQAHDHPL